MPESYPYLIVGPQLAGASAAEGIREVDPNGRILLVGREQDLPYHRPPLSKDLWFGKKSVDEVYVHDRPYYEQNGIELALGKELVALDPKEKTVTGADGERYGYGKLLLATGGQPRRLDIPGANLPGVFYYRALDDYHRLREVASEGASAALIGGGFIGSEMAAALHANGVHTTMLFDGPYLCDRVFPESLGMAIQRDYEQRGIKIHASDVPVAIRKSGEGLSVETQSGAEIACDFAVVGIGIAPEMRLAENAGLKAENGIVVDDELRTSEPDIYAAGDNAAFPYRALDRRMRVEHWDNALNQGKQAGRNMAGAGEPYTYMPFFFSDLFEFGYEAVGEVSSRLSVFADWQQENEKGVLYYLSDGQVRGVLLCNVWDKVEDARKLIREGKQMGEEDLRGAIR